MAEIITRDYTGYFKNRDWVHQLGFCAPDWKQFMLEHNKLFGSGPFFYTTNTFGKLYYHGDEVDCAAVRSRRSQTGSWILRSSISVMYDLKSNGRRRTVTRRTSAS